jgi:dynein intermediate chain 2
MADTHSYQKERKKFGRHPQFEDSATKSVCEQMPDATNNGDYIRRDPNRINMDNVATYSQHSMNTDRVATKDQGMLHDEGGWPKGCDPEDDVSVARYKKKMSKEPTYKEAARELTRTSERCIRQNNEIDLFEEYFVGEGAERMSEDISTKTLMIFKDPNQIKRSVT